MQSLAANEDQLNSLDDSQALLDEALDALKPADREVLLMRYFEKTPYHEIANKFQKSEDACRKQSSRALEKLGSILRARGHVIPSIAISTALSIQLGKSAPVALTTSLLKSSPTAVLSASKLTITLNSFQTMAYTKTKIALVATIIASIPISLQWQENHDLRKKLSHLDDSPNGHGLTSQSASDVNPPHIKTSAHPSETLTLENSRKQELPNSNWPGLSESFTIPRSLLTQLTISPFNSTTLKISNDMKTILELTPSETTQLEDGLRTIRQGIRDHEMHEMEQVNMTDDLQEYLIPAFPKAGKKFIADMEQILVNTIGEDRARFFISRNEPIAEAFSHFGKFSRQIIFTRHEGANGESLTNITTTEYKGTGEQKRVRRTVTNPRIEQAPSKFSHLFQIDQIAPE